MYLPEVVEPTSKKKLITEVVEVPTKTTKKKPLTETKE